MDTSRESTSADRLGVLHALRLGGFLDADAIARRTGLSTRRVDAELSTADAAGSVTHRTGRITGWTLTAQGRTEHTQLLADEVVASGARAHVERADAAFVSLNDHSDDAYDAAVVDDLAPVHDQVSVLTGDLAAVVPRFGRYPDAFAAALHRLRSGDRRAFAAPLSESYHDIWMELHQDLLSTLGRDRSSADGH